MSEATEVWIDADRCIASGVCESVAADLFQVGDDSVAQVISPVEPNDSRVLTAVQACPTGAIMIGTSDNHH